MLTFALSIVVKALVLVAVLALAGRALLRALFGRQAEDWAGATAAGAIVLYLAWIATRNAWTVAVLMLLAAAAGAWLAMRTGPRAQSGARPRWWELVIVVLLALASVGVPVTEWDARSIWFYHAKVVYHYGLDPVAWHQVATQTGWSHPYYPKLLPVLAGTAAKLFGVWNDHLPKLAVAILVAPALLLGGRLFADWRLRALFWALMFAVGRRFLWNGYMDAVLAVWSAVAVLYAVAGTVGAVPAARAISVAGLALAVCAGLKVEGWVIAACVAGAFAALHLPRWRAWRAHAAPLAGAAALVLLPYFAWRVYARLADLGESWASFSGEYLARAMQRLGGAELRLIAAEMFRPTMLLTLALLAAALIALRRAGAEWRRAALAGVLALALYCAALFFVYLGTPLELGYHLQTSVARTMMPPRTWILALLLAACLVWRGGWRAPAT